jgi:hypothetical protein
MTIAYVAYTEGNVLMLDGDGVCIRVEPLRSRMSLGALAGRRPEPSDGALRCIGAQYVASIDPSAPGGLAHLPSAGTSMLFAATGADGRIYCVRAGPLTHFESCTPSSAEAAENAPDAEDSGVHHSPNDTQKQENLAWEDVPTPMPGSGRRESYVPHSVGPFNDKTDPGFSVSLHGDEEVEPETAPYPSTRYSQVGYHQSSRSTPVPPPPPPPRLPRIQTTPLPIRPMPLPSRRVAVPSGTRPMAYSPSPIAPTPYGASKARTEVPRARPPAPSSHAWLRSSPAAERRWR